MGKTEPAVRWEREGPVGVLILDRPGCKNALTLESRDELVAAVERLASERDLRAAIVCGAGGAFCAGGDLEGLAERARGFQARGGVRPLFSNRLARALLAVEVPLIAAVAGPAVGAGLAVCLACDLRIASEDARFAAGATRAGLSPEYGTSFLLPRTVGRSLAAAMILCGHTLDAAEAFGAGLVTEVVQGRDLMARARELAGGIAAQAPVAVRLAKRALLGAMDATLEGALAIEELAATHSLSSDDHLEAVSALLEKRPPRFSDR